MKRLALGLVTVLSMASVYAQGETLDDVCLKDDAEQVLAYALQSDSIQEIADSIGITTENVSVAGTCDSAAIYYQTGLFQLRLGYVKKMNSCSLFTSFGVIEPVDTITNVCDVSPVRHQISSVHLGRSSSTIALHLTAWPHSQLIPYRVSQSKKVHVYNSLGVLVRTLGPVHGTGTVTWDGTDHRGTPVSPGSYFVKIRK